MSNYALTDADGYIIAFYDDILIPHVPAGSFRISDAVWSQWAANVNGLRWDGITLVQGSRPLPQSEIQVSKHGLTVEFKLTTALSATYSVLPSAMAEMNMVENYVNKNGAFPPRNAETLDWPDIDGKMHTFPNIETFKAWSTVMLDHVIGLKAATARTSTTPIVLDL